MKVILAGRLLSFVYLSAAHRPYQVRAPDSVTAYAPSTNVACPDLSTAPLVRRFSPQNQTLHPDEERYVTTRSNNILPGAWKDWIGDGSSLGYNLSTYTGPFPKIGLAVPGGGLRAALYGAGCLLGLDSRNQTSKAAGTGGLLQVASYMTGLSGGSWITGSLFFNDWPNINDLVFGDGKDLGGWLLDLPFVTPDGSDILSDLNQAFYGSLLWSIIAKAEQGIDTSLTDIWSRMISYHFLNQTSRSNFFTNDSAHGAGQLWSQIPQIPSYQNHLVPFPIAVADSRPSGSNLTTILPLNSVVYEITPMEIASYDPSLSSGMNLTFAGTHLASGRSINGSACVVGFDQAGFIMGSSASLFNQFLDFAHNTISQFSDSDSSGLLYLLSRQLTEVRTRANDVANWPNPFQDLDLADFQDNNASWLELIDGASNQENIPFGPLLVRARALDVIVTIEGSADDPVNNWPNGTGLLFSSTRQTKFLQNSHQAFPPLPSSPEEFISTGVNARPTFFGCDPPQPDSYPLIIYLPNAPPISGDNPTTNTPTFKLSYSQLHNRVFMDQVFSNTISGFVPFSHSSDPRWGLCLQCAAFDRARSKMMPVIPRSGICDQCFKQYCFDPSNLSSKSELLDRILVFVDPDPQDFTKVHSFLGLNKFKLLGGLIGLLFLIVLVAAFLVYRKKKKSWPRSPKYQKLSHAHLNLVFEPFSTQS